MNDPFLDRRSGHERQIGFDLFVSQIPGNPLILVNVKKRKYPFPVFQKRRYLQVNRSSHIVHMDIHHMRRNGVLNGDDLIIDKFSIQHLNIFEILNAGCHFCGFFVGTVFQPDSHSSFISLDFVILQTIDNIFGHLFFSLLSLQQGSNYQQHKNHQKNRIAATFIPQIC